jgi:hypothetical protein
MTIRTMTIRTMSTSFLFLVLFSVQGIGEEAELPLIHKDAFDSENPLTKWFATQGDRWKITKTESSQGEALHLLGVSSKYNPPYRSPHSVLLLKNQVVGDFVLTAKVKTLQTTRGHRDMCIFFGWQGPASFYYVHLGELKDPNSSQIFIVKDAPRTPITEKNGDGIPWKDGQWHDVKVVRTTKDGLIAVYFDDMETPVKVAHDKSFAWGMLGLGSFDDLGMWDDVVVRATKVDGKKPTLPQPNRAGPTKQKP